MNFTPKSAEELQLAELMPEGEYDFRVMSAEDTVSKKTGNEMIKLKLVVYCGEREFHIFDYLLEAMAFKLRHFCEAVGIVAKYEAGTLRAEDCEGVAGLVKIKVEKQKKDSEFGPKNAVADYISRDAVKIEAAPSKPKYTPGLAPELEEDDIPFKSILDVDAVLALCKSAVSICKNAVSNAVKQSRFRNFTPIPEWRMAV